LRHEVERVPQKRRLVQSKDLKNRVLGFASYRSFLAYVGVVAAVTKNASSHFWGVPALVPGIANAIFAATGKRIQEFAMLDQMLT